MSEVVTLPKLGMDMQEGTFINWVKNVGDTVKAGEVLAEVESDKATIEIESTASGTLLETLVQAGQTVTVGAPIARVGEAGSKPEPKKESSANGSEAKPAPKPTLVVSVAAPATDSQRESSAESQDEHAPGGVKASPVARKIAEEKHIDLNQVHGSGPGGRIVKSDVESFQPTAAQPAPTAALTAPRAVTVPSGPGITEQPISRMRQRIASRMVESKQNVPHFYVTSEIDMAPALALRKEINESLPEEQKLTVNDLTIKAAALALRQYPNLNSHYYSDKLIHYEHINIGIAVALDNGGLLNVVAKDADITSISRMAQRNKELINAARSGKVRPEDLEGSTFTVSNLGAYDVEHFIAIITPPEAGILAIGSARQVPVVVNGELKIGTRMKCTLSVDHRVSDGAEGAQFMQAFKKLLETPMRLLV